MGVALVTGTSSGFGRGAAERLVRLGWTVIGTVRDPTRTPAPRGCATAALDLRDPESIAALAHDVMGEHGRLDALVSNAGVAVLGPIEELSLAELRDQLEVNLIGTLALCRACLPALRAVRGVIVQVSSVSGRVADGGFGAYNASKYGLEGASEALAIELEAQGVRVVMVEPGPFRTAIGVNMRTARARGSTGCYVDTWRELDEFARYIADRADPDDAAVDAIVAAAVVPGAPRRIPVGRHAPTWIRDQLEELAANDRAAEQFLAANAGLGIEG